MPILLRGADGAQGPTGPAGADGTIIYSGDYNPDPNLGKIGDFYFGRLVTRMFGPKTVSGWGAGTFLKGSDGTNGTNGTNGNTILSGGGSPQNTLGNNGDFYIDLSTYTMYGPKAGGVWSFPGMSLKGADGNSNVIALETADNVTFSWIVQTDNYVLRKQGVSFNDTTMVFNIPAANFTAAKTGVVMVYIRKNSGGGSYSWQQLNYTEKTNAYTVNYVSNLRVNAADAKVRISYNNPFVTHQSYPVDKVRIVIIPPSSIGTLGTIAPNQSPMLQAMQKLHLSDKDFIKIQ
ncbi:hypothetical protein EZ449_15245 [Pedobacter frigidisoli]|uniref:Collagen triple helix repeat-containing protein n=1 Tax=Pedobacter frigidisoli TaxID=2530455 RepID=A0A4R0NZC0_9SPHI|nr:hypothetical protein EZ449_15245 [Pedobacter frigidisoli]